METLIGKHWHHLPADEVLDLLESKQEKGLDILEVEHRQKRFGPNLITVKKGMGPLMRFLLQFHQPLIYILIAAGAITAFLQEWVDSGVTVVVGLMRGQPLFDMFMAAVALAVGAIPEGLPAGRIAMQRQFGGVGVIVILQGLFTYLPAMNRVFHSAPIGPEAWGRIWQ